MDDAWARRHSATHVPTLHSQTPAELHPTLKFGAGGVGGEFGILNHAFGTTDWVVSSKIFLPTGCYFPLAGLLHPWPLEVEGGKEEERRHMVGTFIGYRLDYPVNGSGRSKVARKRKKAHGWHFYWLWRAMGSDPLSVTPAGSTSHKRASLLTAALACSFPVVKLTDKFWSTKVTAATPLCP